MASAFRFVTSSKRGQYSVWRGDEHVGYVTKVTHRITDRGVTRTFSSWIASTNGRDLPSEKTRDEAARALWAASRGSR